MTEEEVQQIYDNLHKNYEYKNESLVSKLSKNAIGSISIKDNNIAIGWTIKINNRNRTFLLQTLVYIYHFKKYYRFFEYKDKNITNLSIENLVPLELRRRVGKGFSRSNKGYRVIITQNKKSFNCGCYIDEETAKNAYEFGIYLLDAGKFVNEVKAIVEEKYKKYLIQNNRTGTIRDLPKGVYKRNNKKKIAYSSYFKGKYLGRFDNQEEAHAAYLKAKEEYAQKVIHGQS